MLETLREGHGLLSQQQFIESLQNGDMEIWSLPFSQYALVAWGDSEDGKALNILTTVGQYAFAAAGLAAIEKLAQSYGAKVVISVGKVGWTRLVTDAGYEVTPCILMKKVLHAN